MLYSFFADAEKKQPELIVHICPMNVVENPSYVEWTNKYLAK